MKYFDIDLSRLFDIAPLTWGGLFCAFFCGAILGLERLLSRKPAGIRTSALICIGTYIFVSLSIDVVNDNGDYSRVLGQIVTGIGFLGAGLMFTRRDIVVGVTSAAIIWFIAALGCLIGFGHHFTAIILALIALGILVGVSFTDRIIRKRGISKQRRFKDPE